MKIKELLTDETKWTQGTYAKNAKGDPVHENSPEASCWCLYGAIYHCYSGIDVFDVLSPLSRKVGNIVRFNDDPNRKFEDIKNLVMELDI